jgi:hypothetical protein
MITKGAIVSRTATSENQQLPASLPAVHRLSGMRGSTPGQCRRHPGPSGEEPAKHRGAADPEQPRIEPSHPTGDQNAHAKHDAPRP